jgi:hypothetical protein
MGPGIQEGQTVTIPVATMDSETLCFAQFSA